MGKRTVLADIRQLQRDERHITWLRTNLPKHKITNRAERELTLLRTAIAHAAGDECERVVEQAGQRGSEYDR